jgi:hypothetical protein
MAWNAITHGAKGIYWYGSGSRLVYEPYYQKLAEVNLELAAVAKLMIRGKINYLKDLPFGVSGISGTGYRVYVNENKNNTATVEGRTIEPHGVLIITDEPLDIPAVKPFVPQKVDGKRTMRFPEKMKESSWICLPGYENCGAQTFYTRQEFTMESIPEKVFLNLAADDNARVFVNGKELGETKVWSILYSYDITGILKPGKNIITTEFSNISGLNGLVYEVISGDNKQIFAASGNNTVISLKADSGFVPAKIAAPHGKGAWGIQRTLKIVK